MNCHRDSLEMTKSSRDGSGTVVSALPMRKCPGVSAEMSSESSLSGSRGREFRIASIWGEQGCRFLKSEQGFSDGTTQVVFE